MCRLCCAGAPGGRPPLRSPNGSGGDGGEGAVDPTNSPWRVALEVLGASAGVIVFVTFVGGAMLWGRFDALGLPADRAVAALPEGTLVTVGAHALAAPIAAGLIAAAVLWIARPLDEEGQPRRRMGVIIAALIAGEIFVLLHVIDLEILPRGAIVVGLSALAAVAVWMTARRTVGYRPIGWAVFAAFAIVGGALAFARTTGTPKMEPAAALLKSGEGISGFFVAESSDRLYLAPLTSGGQASLGEDVSGLYEIPRDEVTRLAIRAPTRLGPDAAGRAEALSLLEELRARQALASHPEGAQAPVIVTRAPEETFAPLVHLHNAERYLPMSADFFLRNSWLAWSHHGCPDYYFPVDQHLRDPAAHANELIGKFDPAKLAGPDAYTHVPSSPPPACRDAPGLRLSAADHTRPFDTKSRPARLPANEGFYLDLANGARRGNSRLGVIGAQTTLEGVPAYYETQPDRTPDGLAALRISYWLFYGLSIPPGPAPFTSAVTHEGDWEGLSVLVRRVGPHRYTPLSVRYNIHNTHADVPWVEAERVPEAPGGGVAIGAPEVEATHPVGYSARGSHATYPALGDHQVSFAPHGIHAFDVRDRALACLHCPDWETWQDLVDARAQPWYGFGGAWGQVGGSGDTTAPLGPSRYKLGGLETLPRATPEEAPAPAVAIVSRPPASH
jgi:hypothetical protein